METVRLTPVTNKDSYFKDFSHEFFTVSKPLRNGAILEQRTGEFYRLIGVRCNNDSSTYLFHNMTSVPEETIPKEVFDEPFEIMNYAKIN